MSRHALQGMPFYLNTKTIAPTWTHSSALAAPEACLINHSQERDLKQTQQNTWLQAKGADLAVNQQWICWHRHRHACASVSVTPKPLLLSEASLISGMQCRDDKSTHSYVCMCVWVWERTVDRLDCGHICFTLPHHVTCSAEKRWDKIEALIKMVWNSKVYHWCSFKDEKKKVSWYFQPFPQDRLLSSFHLIRERRLNSYMLIGYKEWISRYYWKNLMSKNLLLIT